jgi:5-oxoprolinase (ATP-hydrolysing)
MAMMNERRFQFAIDRGGTFTDVYCEIVSLDGRIVYNKRVLKLLSEDPSNYLDAPTEGIRRILEQEIGRPFPRNEPIDTSLIKFIRMGTTVATNALLERKGEKIALLTTSGFKDLQIIGNQSRPKIFDLKITRPGLLFSHVEEINERVILVEDQTLYPPERVVTGQSHELLYIEKPINEDEVYEKLNKISLMGIKSIAVVFMHSYTFSQHEQTVKRIAEEMGFQQISLSSETMPMIRIVPRGGKLVLFYLLIISPSY